jgi:hypothetical protein
VDGGGEDSWGAEVGRRLRVNAALRAAGHPPAVVPERPGCPETLRRLVEALRCGNAAIEAELQGEERLSGG